MFVDLLNYCVIFLTFLFHRVLWDLSVIPTEHTWRAKPIPVCVQYYSIWWSTFLFFHILYIKIHAQVLYNTIPSNSFMYLFNHGWHGFGDWLSLPLIGAIGIKIKILYGFCAHSTVTLYLHYVVFVFMNKKQTMVISVSLSAICWYWTIRLPFIEVCRSLTKAFSNSLKADRPYSCIKERNVHCMHGTSAAQRFSHSVCKRKCPHRWNLNWMNIYYSST